MLGAEVAYVPRDRFAIDVAGINGGVGPEGVGDHIIFAYSVVGYIRKTAVSSTSGDVDPAQCRPVAGPHALGVDVLPAARPRVLVHHQVFADVAVVGNGWGVLRVGLAPDGKLLVLGRLRSLPFHLMRRAQMSLPVMTLL
ncbi:MAG: hypothetical protein WBF05_12575 [Anaerolineales bacterium]